MTGRGAGRQPGHGRHSPGAPAGTARAASEASSRPGAVTEADPEAQREPRGRADALGVGGMGAKSLREARDAGPARRTGPQAAARTDGPARPRSPPQEPGPAA